MMWNVFFKEAREIVRDKRAMIFMLLMPAVVIPALLFGYAWVAGTMEMQERGKTLHYAVLAGDGAPLLNGMLGKQGFKAGAAPASAEEAVAAIRARKLDFVLVFPASGEGALIDAGAQSVMLYYDTASVFDGVGKRVKPILDGAYAEALRVAKLERAGVRGAAASAINRPFGLVVKSTASDRERQGELLGAVLPYILLMLGVTASSAVAIDLGAGEKERGTLESLLLLPVPRTSIVLAKFLIILAVGVISGTIGVSSLALCATFLLEAAGFDVISNLLDMVHVGDFVLLGLLMLPAYAIVAALLLAMSIFSRSHKEAASYANQFNLLIIIPLMISMLPGMKLSDGWSFVPITNIALSVKNIIKGSANLAESAIVFGSTSLLAAALLFFCVGWCRRESVLFRA